MTERLDTPGPMMRRGPRPLLLHLMHAMLRSHGCPDLFATWSPDWPIWKTGETDDAPDPTAALQRDRALIAGIAAYRRHPWQRELPDPPVLWREGGSTVLDYRDAADTAGVTVLFVPSLVNRSYVLDLMPGHSMLRWLAANGVRPLLLDWGWPGELERQFTLTDYVAGRLERALRAVVATCGGRVVLAGYCMGGTLAIATADRRPDLLEGLALLATPWDFHAGYDGRGAEIARGLGLFEPVMALSGTLPVDALQMMFAALDPAAVAEKYRRFARLDTADPRARLFVALEDWLNDGVPLAAPVARECLSGWYGENTPAAGTWRIAGLAVDPRRIRLPCFIAAPGRDRIVPPESARPLSRLIEGAVLHEPAAGHIGMVAGSAARPALWQVLRDWLAARREVPVTPTGVIARSEARKQSPSR